MSLTDIFNSIGNQVQKINQPLSSLVQKPAQPVPVIAPKPVKYQLKNRGVVVSDEDINAVRPLIYGEVSNRTPDKQALEANVIMNTALNRMREYAANGQPKTLAEVIAMPKQYQAYGGPQYQAYSTSSNVLDKAKKAQVDAIINQIHEQIKTGEYPDNTQGAYYYIHNPDQTITYDNTKPLFAKKKKK